MNGQHVAQRLARVVVVGQAVNHWNRGVFSKFLNGAVAEYTQNHGIAELAQNTREVRHRFTLANGAVGGAEKHA